MPSERLNIPPYLARMQKEKILAAVGVILAESHPLADRLLAVCGLIQQELEHYDWVGFYLVDPNEDRMLVLGPYVGAATDHTRIPFGTGICGQAAETLETFVVPDVSKAGNYLACSITVKSEIVVPLMHEGRFLGELDIDSHVLDNFGPDDRDLMEKIAALIAPELAKA